MKEETKTTHLLCHQRAGKNAVLLAGILFSALLVSNAPAQTNLFNDGYGDDPTPLDQFPSAPGAGWTGPWRTNVSNNVLLDQTNIVNTSPLNGGGNYLTWRTAGNGACSISRPYVPANLNLSWPYVIEFDYRCDYMQNGAAL